MSSRDNTFPFNQFLKIFKLFFNFKFCFPAAFDHHEAVTSWTKRYCLKERFLLDYLSKLTSLRVNRYRYLEGTPGERERYFLKSKRSPFASVKESSSEV